MGHRLHKRWWLCLKEFACLSDFVNETLKFAMDVISLDVVHLKGKALTLSKLIMAGVHVIYGRNFITCAIMLVHRLERIWRMFPKCCCGDLQLWCAEGAIQKKRVAYNGQTPPPGVVSTQQRRMSWRPNVKQIRRRSDLLNAENSPVSAMLHCGQRGHHRQTCKHEMLPL